MALGQSRLGQSGNEIGQTRFAIGSEFSGILGSCFLNEVELLDQMADLCQAELQANRASAIYYLDDSHLIFGTKLGELRLWNSQTSDHSKLLTPEENVLDGAIKGIRGHVISDREIAIAITTSNRGLVTFLMSKKDDWEMSNWKASKTEKPLLTAELCNDEICTSCYNGKVFWYDLNHSLKSETTVPNLSQTTGRFLCIDEPKVFVFTIAKKLFVFNRTESLIFFEGQPKGALARPEDLITSLTRIAMTEFIVTTTYDGKISIWNLKTFKEVHQIDTKEIVTNAALSPDGKFLATFGAEPSDETLEKSNRSNLQVFQLD